MLYVVADLKNNKYFKINYCINGNIVSLSDF